VHGLRLKILQLFKKLLMNHVRITRRKEVEKGGEVRGRQATQAEKTH